MEKTFETKEVVIKKLVTEGLQIRVEMNEESVEHYAAVYRESMVNPAIKKLPPVTVFYDSMGDEYYLADGFHRVAAAKLNGADKILAEVHEGTYDDAMKFALQANAENSIQRTKADQLHALEIAWAQWDTLYKNMKRTTKDGAPSRCQLMEICAVTEHMAKLFLQDMRSGESPDATVSKVTGRELLATSERVKNAVATKGNRHHLEERNKTVKEHLAAGEDRYGVEIPERILPAFTSCSPSAFIHDLGILRDALGERLENRDIAFAHGIEYALRDLDATIRDLRQGQAHCVCRMCRGKGCGSCSNLGFQTKLQYDRAPREYKAEQQ